MNDDENKKQCKEFLIGFVEYVDDKIGGPIMDLPAVDKIERNIVESIVDIVWLLPLKYQDADELFPWSA